MTRNDVAQLVLNALEAGTVEAETDGSITVGDITFTNGVSITISPAAEDYADSIDRVLDTSIDGATPAATSWSWARSCTWAT